MAAAVATTLAELVDMDPAATTVLPVATATSQEATEVAMVKMHLLPVATSHTVVSWLCRTKLLSLLSDSCCLCLFP